MRTFRALALAVAVAACRPGPVAPPDTSPLPSAEVLAEELRQDAAARTSMRSLGRVTYFGEKGRVRLSAVLLAERPGKLRVETLSPLEQPVDVMVTDGQRLTLLSGGRLREGPATPENIARLIPISLWPEELVEVLLGGVPRSERYRPSALERHPDREGRWRLSLLAEGGQRVELAVEPASRRIEEVVSREAGGRVSFTVRYDEHEAIAGLPGELPRRIVIEMKEPELEVTIKLRELEVNVPMDAELFRLIPPPGVRPERLDSPPVALPPGASYRDPEPP